MDEKGYAMGVAKHNYHIVVSCRKNITYIVDSEN